MADVGAAARSGDERSPRTNRVRAALVALLLVVGAALLFGAGDQFVQHLEAWRAWVAAHGAIGVAVFALAYTVATTLLAPASVFTVAAGALLGFPRGAAAVAIGHLLAVSLQFAVARGVLAGPVERLVAHAPRLGAMQRAVVHRGLGLQTVIRLAPLNVAMVSFALAGAGVRFAPFLVASLAHLPALGVEVWVGVAGHRAAGVVGRTRESAGLEDALYVVGAVAALVAVLFVARAARAAVERAEDEEELEAEELGSSGRDEGGRAG
ncbi:MAG: hypothetical protein R3F34_03550 [Planctomycetota bacterium]